MAPIRILGVDPGLRNMGWGVIEAEGSRLSFVACGTVKSDQKQDMAERLKHLFEQLSEIVRQYQPDEAAVEESFVNKDARATLKLGQARGIAMVVPALAGVAGLMDTAALPPSERMLPSVRCRWVQASA